MRAVPSLSMQPFTVRVSVRLWLVDVVLELLVVDEELVVLLDEVVLLELVVEDELVVDVDEVGGALGRLHPLLKMACPSAFQFSDG